mmetsp:Transcript_34920/g.93390  ORF Transcript_34920/g.93390 Transcript_34920/m.93390 type:complete len:219 (+) Transcript_34920:335-991(+)
MHDGSSGSVVHDHLTEGMGDDEERQEAEAMLTSARGPNGGGNGRGGVEYVKLSNGTYLTKHDAGINGRNNAREATDRFDKMGDLVDDKVSIPNTTFNSLKKSMKRVNGVVKGVSTRGAVSNEDRATRDGVLDPVTRELVFKLINGGVLESMHGVIKTGKESCVYYAEAAPMKQLMKKREEKMREYGGRKSRRGDDSSSNGTVETDLDVDFFEGCVVAC